MNRTKSIQYYQLAREMADIFSKDPSTRVGAILLAPNSYQILSMGYNGMPRGIDETVVTRWQRPGKYRLVEHAERNALYNACRHGTPLEDSIAVITLMPCMDCARGLIQSGIKTVVTRRDPDLEERWGKDWDMAEALFIEAGVESVKLTLGEVRSKIDVSVKLDD